MMDYRIEASSSRVEACSSSRLAFEPKGWQLDYRAELRQALRALKPVSGHVLVAELLTDDDHFFDVENVLLYNVGTSNVRPVTVDGLAFRRLASASRHMSYRTRYTVAAMPDWLPGRRLGAR